MSRVDDCVFCKIVSVQAPSSVIFENNSIISFLDINPLADGHVLIVPRDHYTGLAEMPSKICSAMFACIPMLGRALLQVTGAEGFNLLINHGSVAGQVVPHVHCHLIPRMPDDGLGYRWPAKQYEEGRSAELATAYQAALSNQV